MGVVDASYGYPMKVEEAANAPLAGGIMNHGYQCGMLWGASLAAGAEAHRRYGAGPQAETAAITASQKLLDTFQTRTQNEINCSEVREFNIKENVQLLPILRFFVKGGKVGPGACFRLAAGYAPDAFSTMDEVLADELPQAPAAPVSCASVLARAMGASEKHAVMASGFAGGIGLSGGGCGALGAAIWLTAMNGREDGQIKLAYFENSKFQSVVDRFLEASDYEFECSAISGRKFESIDQHAAYVREGGCADIIAALAAGVGDQEPVTSAVVQHDK
jgi:hypothetical protein